MTRPRLKSLAPRVRPLAPAVRPHTIRTHERMRTAAWESLRRQVLTEAGGLCECDECRELRRVRPAHEVDHHVPIWEGGTDARDNLRAINHDCHQAKSERERRRRYGLPPE